MIRSEGKRARYLSRFCALIFVLLTGLTASGCGEAGFLVADPTSTPATRPDQAISIAQSFLQEYDLSQREPALGRRLMVEYGCISCHQIPGVPGANATVGPPLTDWSERHYISGTEINTPENLVRWIQNPQAIDPKTAMPNMGVSEEDALDIAAYLFGLGEGSMYLETR